MAATILFDMEVASDESYRTCSQCGSDCDPDPFVTDEGIQIAFICATCGIDSVVDPFRTAR